ncbi:MAG: TonB family protein [Deltaproteobacteria bacterium]|nr:TonB family protein [Deltaproteobacteria bacterium]
MKAAPLLVLVMACGGGSAPPAKPEPVLSERASTRVPVEEDENEDGVTMLNSRGRMDPKVIEAGIAPHTVALTECYTTQLKKRRWLGGHVVIHWDISKDGTVTAVRLAESDLGAWPIEKCLLDVARLAVFGPPINGDADFQIPLDFTAKGRLISWDEDQAVRAVGGQLVKLDVCATKKIAAPSDVTVTVYVGPGGKAQSVGFASTAVIDDAWAECAAKAALALRLPDPKGQIAKLAVKYRAE